MHVYNESKETQARIQCRATTEYDLLHRTLKQFYFTRLAPHTHIYTKPKENRSRDFPLRVESLSRDRNSELLRRGPRARAARRSCGPPDSTDGVLGKRTGFSDAFFALAHGIQGSRKDQKGEEEEAAPGTRIRQEQNPTLQEQDLDDQPTNDPRETAYDPSSSVPFVARGSALRSALCSAPFLAPPPFAALAEKSRRGALRAWPYVRGRTWKKKLSNRVPETTTTQAVPSLSRARTCVAVRGKKKKLSNNHTGRSFTLVNDD